MIHKPEHKKAGKSVSVSSERTVNVAGVMVSSNPMFGHHKWVKLWVDAWLDGTTRFETTGAQRAFFVDLLAWAGRSRFPGFVCPGMSGKKLMGYPLKWYEALATETIDIEATFELFRRTGKIAYTVTAETPQKLIAVQILNWPKYQSDLGQQARRAAAYRERKKMGRHLTHHVRVTREKKKETKKESTASAKTAEAVPAAAAFAALGRETPFGPDKFQAIWAEVYAGATASDTLTDKMEEAIQRCQKEGIKMPKLFFDLKRKVEELELERQFHRTPL